MTNPLDILCRERQKYVFINVIRGRKTDKGVKKENEIKIDENWGRELLPPKVCQVKYSLAKTSSSPSC